VLGKIEESSVDGRLGGHRGIVIRGVVPPVGVVVAIIGQCRILEKLVIGIVRQVWARGRVAGGDAVEQPSGRVDGALEGPVRLRAIEIVGEPQVAGAVQGQAKWIAPAGRLND
jgi:hypothetical protein